MSFAQWRLWFLEQLRPGTNAWNTPVVARLEGPLEIESLRRALRLVVERQATLRTVFPAGDNTPVPVVIEHPVVDLPVIDLERPGSGAAQELDDARMEADVMRAVDHEVRRPFDLTSDLMVRVRLLRLMADRHVLILVAHHIACDGWSKGLLLSELGTAYDAFCAGTMPELPELTIDYGDFAAWQRDWLTGRNLDRLTAYWAERLRDHAAAAELPIDMPRPAIQAFRGAVQRVAVPRALADAAVALGRRDRATPFMTLMATFMALLHAHSGQQDLLVGSPAAMRNQPELQPIVGLFANTLVYRTDLSGRPSLSELIQRVRETALGVYQHQDLPFEKIVEAVKPRRDASRNPLVQVNMRVEGTEPELRLHALRWEAIPVDPGIARFDLAVELGATDDGFAGYLEYDTSLFEPATAATLAGQFVDILESAVASPKTPLDELEPVRRIRARATANAGAGGRSWS